jgi:hypothetical protein
MYNLIFQFLVSKRAQNTNALQPNVLLTGVFQSIMHLAAVVCCVC